MDNLTPSAIDSGSTASTVSSTPTVTAPDTTTSGGFDPATLPAEFQPHYKQVEDHFNSKYKGFDDFKSRATAFDEALKDPSFSSWYYNRGKPQNAAPEQPRIDPAKAEQLEDLSPEQFSEVMNDPKAFKQYIKAQAEAIAAPKIRETENKVEIMRRQTEISSFADTHQDFWDLDEKGLIEPLMKKYPKADLEDIWKMARHDTLKQDAVNRAHNIVRTKQAATTERPGVSTTATQQQVKVKNRSEAMLIAAEYHKNGRTPPDFVFESTR